MHDKSHVLICLGLPYFIIFLISFSSLGVSFSLSLNIFLSQLLIFTMCIFCQVMSVSRGKATMSMKDCFIYFFGNLYVSEPLWPISSSGVSLSLLLTPHRSPPNREIIIIIMFIMFITIIIKCV